jgi:hypothetical protein
MLMLLVCVGARVCVCMFRVSCSWMLVQHVRAHALVHDRAARLCMSMHNIVVFMLMHTHTNWLSIFHAVRVWFVFGSCFVHGRACFGAARLCMSMHNIVVFMHARTHTTDLAFFTLLLRVWCSCFIMHGRAHFGARSCMLAHALVHTCACFGARSCTFVHARYRVCMHAHACTQLT